MSSSLIERVDKMVSSNVVSNLVTRILADNHEFNWFSCCLPNHLLTSVKYAGDATLANFGSKCMYCRLHHIVTYFFEKYGISCICSR